MLAVIATVVSDGQQPCNRDSPISLLNSVHQEQQMALVLLLSHACGRGNSRPDTLTVLFLGLFLSSSAKKKP